MAVEPYLGMVVFVDAGQTKVDGVRADAARSFLAAPFEAIWFLAVCSALWTPSFTLWCQVSLYFGEGLPSVRIDLNALHVSFADVFEPQLWSANATGTVSELVVQNFSRQSMRIHAVNVAKPPEASVTEQGGHTQ